MHGFGHARPAVLSTIATTITPRSHDPNAAIVLPADLRETVAAALKEDIGSGDLTAALVPAGRMGRAKVITR